MIDESQFHTLTDAYLMSLSDRLEAGDKAQALEIDIDSGVLTIELTDGKQFVVTKHAPTRQVWLSSPVSGGLHFSYNETAGEWMLSDGRTLEEILTHELKKLTGHAYLVQA